MGTGHEGYDHRFLAVDITPDDPANTADVDLTPAQEAHIASLTTNT